MSILIFMDIDFSREGLEKLTKSQLIDIILSFKTELDELKSKIEKPKKNSKNSSKPPSSEYKSNNDTIKNRGGSKKGHKKQNRKLRKAGKTVYIDIDKCPNCGRHHFSFSKSYTRHQILELGNIEIKVIDIYRQKSTCGLGDRGILASNPPGVFDNDIFGPKLKSFILMLHYHNKLSYDDIVDFIFTYTGMVLSKGSVVNLVESCGNNLKVTYENIQKEIQNSEVIGIDETGWRVDGKNFWVWVFQNEHSVLYTIENNRSSKTPISILGDYFDGVVVSDFFSAYNKVISPFKQKCLAHLIRSLQYVFEVTGKKQGSYSDRLINLFRSAIHLKNSISFNSEFYKKSQLQIENELDDLIKEKVRYKDEVRIQKRLIKYRADLLLFLRFENVPATNNASERDIRKCVIHRKICNGSRSVKGSKTYSIISSVIQSLKKSKKNMFIGLIDLFNKLSIKEPRISYRKRHGFTFQ